MPDFRKICPDGFIPKIHMIDVLKLDLMRDIKMEFPEFTFRVSRRPEMFVI